MPRPRRPDTRDPQPSREGMVAVSVWVPPEKRAALKIAAIERGTTVQDLLAAAVDRILSETAR